MFFWFFRQLFYISKRFIKHKLFLFFMFFLILIFLFIKSSFAYSVDGKELVNLPNVILSDFQTRANEYYNNNNYYIYGYQDLSSGKYFIIVIDKSRLNNELKGYFNSSGNRGYFNQPVYEKIYRYNDNFTFDQVSSWGTRETSSNSVRITTYSNFIYWYSNFDMFTNNSYTVIAYGGSIINPFITTDNSSIINWTFDNLTINGGNTLSSNYSHYLYFTYPNNNTSYEFNIDNYYTIVNNVLLFNIPRLRITDDIVIRDGAIINFSIISRENLEGGQSLLVNDLGSYTLDLSLQSQQEINEDSNKQLLSNINQEQQQTTQAIENLNNFITNSNIDDANIYLPIDNTQDITQDGINNIFTSIYNAFCSGVAQNIVFPIPFTNKNITLEANYIRDMLSNNNANWLITIIEAFWWYLISRFIISDISKK